MLAGNFNQFIKYRLQSNWFWLLSMAAFWDAQPQPARRLNRPAIKTWPSVLRSSRSISSRALLLVLFLPSSNYSMLLTSKFKRFVQCIKVSFSYLWQLLTFSFGVSSNFSQRKSTTAKIIGLHFLGTIVPRKYMPTIFAVGLFCFN